MLAIGWNALTLPSVGVLSNTADPAGFTTVNGSNDPQVQQLQAQLQESQARERQYQSQLAQANQQLQEYQQVIEQLQQNGLIRITADGQIQLGRRGNATSCGHSQQRRFGRVGRPQRPPPYSPGYSESRP